jgi:hypothetical protein
VRARRNSRKFNCEQIAARDQPQTEVIIENMEEAIQSCRQYRYSPVNSGCMKFLFIPSLASALVRDS